MITISWILMCINVNAVTHIKTSQEIASIIKEYYFFEEDYIFDQYTKPTKQIMDIPDKYSEYYPPSLTDNTQVKDNYFSKKLFGLCYIKFTNFLEGTDIKLKNSLAEFKDSNSKTLILDLSFCDGGDLDSAINIAKHLVPKGKICEIKFKNETKTYYSALEICPFDNIIILTSPQTASASEILISSLKESGCAVVIGTHTYGKTAVQRNFALSNGGVLKLTVGKYYTRNNYDIEEKGITPDFNIIPTFCILIFYLICKLKKNRQSSI